jgi:hypothetical protein
MSSVFMLSKHRPHGAPRSTLVDLVAKAVYGVGQIGFAGKIAPGKDAESSLDWRHHERGAILLGASIAGAPAKPLTSSVKPVQLIL